MIELVIPRSVASIVRAKYTDLYAQRRRSLGTTYPRTVLLQNIRDALSCNGFQIREIDLKEPIVDRWKTMGYKVFSYYHWYYAVIIKKDKNGKIIAIANDALYEGDYHNDTMQTQPYDESIKKALSLIERIENL